MNGVGELNIHEVKEKVVDIFTQVNELNKVMEEIKKKAKAIKGNTLNIKGITDHLVDITYVFPKEREVVVYIIEEDGRVVGERKKLRELRIGREGIRFIFSNGGIYAVWSDSVSAPKVLTLYTNYELITDVLSELRARYVAVSKNLDKLITLMNIIKDTYELVFK